LTGAASADWLVLRDGARVETKGPWTVKGNLVVFTLPNSTLGSLRGADLDLEASSRATAEAKAAAEAKVVAAAQPPALKPVLVLTDKDVEHIDPATIVPSAPTGQSVPGATAPAPAAAPQGAVQIADWDQSLSQADNGVMITGTVTNKGTDTALAVTVTARLYDDAGKLLGTAPASLSTEALPSGQSARFTVVFPGILTFSSAQFDVDSTPVKSTPPAGEDAS